MGSIPELSVIKGAQKPNNFDLLHRLFEKQTKEADSEKLAIIYNDTKLKNETTISYQHLNSSANRIASMLLNRINKQNLQSNVDGDFIIAVCMPPNDHLLVILLAILKTGAAYLPLDSSFPSNRINHILQEAKPVCVIYDDAIVNQNLFNACDAISYATCVINSKQYDDVNITDERMLCTGYLATILYTSGSTGVPKGVRIPHSIVLNRLRWQWETFPYSATEQICAFKTALTFVDSVSEIWGPLLTGRTILAIPKCITKDPTQLVAALDQYGIERLVVVPTLLKSILIYLSIVKNSKLLRHLKLWICSGESLSSSLAIEFYDYFSENAHMLCNFYGSTEIMGDVTYFICERKEQLMHYLSVPIGRPINNTNIYILNSEMKPVMRGAIGELYVSGANLAHGYVNGRDKDRFVENPLTVEPQFARLYRTGDYASLQADGNVHYEGRTDSQIKIRGHRVDLSEIEKNLLNIDGIDKGIVLCYHTGQIDQAILAFTVIHSKSSLHEMQIENILRTNLPDYMQPQVVIVETLPLLVNGKVDRQTLLKMYENVNNNDDPEIVIDYDYEGISSADLPTAKVLFETIGEVVGRSTRATISKNSNFFELGGNSLNSIYTVAKLRERRYSIEISEFISANTLGDMMAHINHFDKLHKKQKIRISSKDTDLKAFTLSDEHKMDTIHIITKSFIEKAELEQQLKPNIDENDYIELIDAIWSSLIEKGYSFVVKDANDRVISIALNFDIFDEPEPEIHGNLQPIFIFLEEVESPIKVELPKDKPILHSFMMGTHESLSPQENIAVMTFMETEVIRIADAKNCAGILTTNTNALTQQLARNVFGYETMLDYQVNQFELNGNKPFGTAPDHYRAIVQWKKL